MLAPAQRDLHLRHDVPVGFSAVHQVAGGEKLHHGRPLAAEPMIGGDGLSNGGVVEEALRRFIGMSRQIGAHLELYPRVGGEELIEGGEWLKDGSAGAAQPGASGGRQHPALQAENRAGSQAGKHHMLQPERNVAHVAGVVVIDVLHVPWNIDFELVEGPETLFMDEVGAPSRRAAGICGGRIDQFFFRKCFFSDECARKVELAARPAVARAEARM